MTRLPIRRAEAKDEILAHLSIETLDFYTQSFSLGVGLLILPRHSHSHVGILTAPTSRH